MSDFDLSPGITPGLVDFFVVEILLAIGLGYAWKRGRGVELAFAANALLLGLIKLGTDYPDFNDDLVSLGAILAGTAFLVRDARPELGKRVGRYAFGLIGLYAVIIGAIKIAYDFSDPFDLMLATATIVTGVWLVVLPPGAETARPTPEPPSRARVERSQG